MTQVAADKETDSTVSFPGTGQAAVSSDLMKAIQKALTGARKADQKVRKLTQDKATKEAQWRQYGKDMKETCEREHRKFLKDLERIDDDLENVLAQGYDAAELVKRLATQGLTALQRPAPMEEDHSTSTCWEELLSRPAASPEMDDGFLRDIGIANLGSAASLTSVFGSLASGQAAFHSARASASCIPCHFTARSAHGNDASTAGFYSCRSFLFFRDLLPCQILCNASLLLLLHPPCLLWPPVWRNPLRAGQWHLQRPQEVFRSSQVLCRLPRIRCCRLHMELAPAWAPSWRLFASANHQSLARSIPHRPLPFRLRMSQPGLRLHRPRTAPRGLRAPLSSKPPRPF